MKSQSYGTPFSLLLAAAAFCISTSFALSGNEQRSVQSIGNETFQNTENSSTAAPLAGTTEGDGSKWNSTEGPGNEWNSMEGVGNDWNSTESAGHEWNSTEGAGHEWNSTEGAGNEWNSMEGVGHEWNSTEGVGNEWNSTEGAGNEWNSTEGAGNEWNSTEGSTGPTNSTPIVSSTSSIESSTEAMTQTESSTLSTVITPSSSEYDTTKSPEPQNSTPDPQDSTPDPQDSTPDPQDSTPDPQDSAPDPQDSERLCDKQQRDGQRCANTGVCVAKHQADSHCQRGCTCICPSIQINGNLWKGKKCDTKKSAPSPFATTSAFVMTWTLSTVTSVLALLVLGVVAFFLIRHRRCHKQSNDISRTMSWDYECQRRPSSPPSTATRSTYAEYHYSAALKSPIYVPNGVPHSPSGVHVGVPHSPTGECKTFLGTVNKVKTAFPFHTRTTDLNENEVVLQTHL